MKDLDDLLNERAKRRRRRPRFGRIIVDGRQAYGGDPRNPFLVRDQLLDRDNPIDSPLSTQGVELDPPAPTGGRVTPDAAMGD
jgi:hypothetical protein